MKKTDHVFMKQVNKLSTLIIHSIIFKTILEDCYQDNYKNEKINFFIERNDLTNPIKSFIKNEKISELIKINSNFNYNFYIITTSVVYLMLLILKANISNKIFLCSAITCGMIYSFDIGYTSLNMLKRRNNFVNFQHQDPLEL